MSDCTYGNKITHLIAPPYWFTKSEK